MKQFRQQKRPKKSSLIGGAVEIVEALASGQAIDRVYIDQTIHQPIIQELKAAAARAGVPVNYVPAAKLNSFNLPDHQGAIAQLARVRYYPLQDIIDQATGEGRIPLFLILDGITDIRNIGGIARTAYSTGVDALIIPDKGVGALNEDAMLTSAGALEHLPICRVNSLMKAVDELHMNGIRVYAAEMQGSTSIQDADFSLPLAVVMGSEEKGIYPALLKICDAQIRIPMARAFESLNVSVATGMILYEVMRQRGFNFEA